MARSRLRIVLALLITMLLLSLVVWGQKTSKKINGCNLLKHEA